jgi:hypothetical protein
MTPEETWSRFDHDARGGIGMSGEEFLDKYDAGEIDVDDPSIHSAAVRLEAFAQIARQFRPTTP